MMSTMFDPRPHLIMIYCIGFTQPPLQYVLFLSASPLPSVESVLTSFLNGPNAAAEECNVAEQAI